MESQWFALKEYLKGNVSAQSDIKEPFFLRLIESLVDKNAKSADVCMAYKDALKCACAHGLEHRSLKINPEFYNQLVFLDCGIKLEQATNNLSLLDDELSPSDRDVYRREVRRKIKKVPIDISLRNRLNDPAYQHYNGIGQALAVRTVLLSDEDSTLVISLPTGCGKTLVIHALALFSATQSVNLVIVPTVGLALEQSNRAKDMLKKAGLDHGGEYCLISGQNEQSKQAIFERLNSGSQRILFTSPEMATRKLLPILFRLATQGRLASFIVDEAHLIDQWGAEFRNEFQQLAPLLMSLREVSPTGIRALLMSATFSPQTLSTLENLYFANKDIQIVDGAFLRPEPTYRVSLCSSDRQYRQCVEQAIINLPRPMIIYATTREEANEWHNYLGRLSFQRIGLFTGDTPDHTRADLIDRWRVGAIDIMVATSAFGVGMDKHDVRSVLHISVPESLGRFYQESGRGGRDGKACLSQLICFSKQFKAAEDLAKEKLISVELGLTRWKAMLARSNKREDGKLIINLDAEHFDIAGKSDRNRMWNWLTLLLMQRANMIRMHFDMPTPPESQNEQMSVDVNRVYYDQYFQQILVELLDDGHRSQQRWNSVINKQRDKEKSARKQGFNILKDWIQDSANSSPNQHLCKTLREYYRFYDYEPETACGGCPACQSKNRLPHTPTLGLSARICSQKSHALTLFGKLDRVYFSNQKSRSMLLHDDWKRWLTRLISTKHVQAIRAEQGVLDELAKVLPKNIGQFWVSLELNAPPTHYDEVVLVMSQDEVLPTIPASNGRQIIIAPEGMRESIQSHRTWWECYANSQSLESFIRQINYVNNQ